MFSENCGKVSLDPVICCMHKVCLKLKIDGGMYKLYSTVLVFYGKDNVTVSEVWYFIRNSIEYREYPLIFQSDRNFFNFLGLPPGENTQRHRAQKRIVYRGPRFLLSGVSQHIKNGYLRSLFVCPSPTIHRGFVYNRHTVGWGWSQFNDFKKRHLYLFLLNAE